MPEPRLEAVQSAVDAWKANREAERAVMLSISQLTTAEHSMVQIIVHMLEQESPQPPAPQPKRGRPKGSRNKSQCEHGVDTSVRCFDCTPSVLERP
jgi:hypothetical protein